MHLIAEAIVGLLVVYIGVTLNKKHKSLQLQVDELTVKVHSLPAST